MSKFFGYAEKDEAERTLESTDNVTVSMCEEEGIEVLTEEQAEERYCDMLDSMYDNVEIGDLSFDPSDVIKECDPTAFRCGFSDYTSDSYIEVHED